MPLKLLISGDRAHFTTLAFDPNKQKLKTVAHYPAPYNVSWVEPMSLQGHVDRLVGLSEGEESGLLFTFEIDHKLRQCRMTSQEPTLGAPAHCESLSAYFSNMYGCFALLLILVEQLPCFTIGQRLPWLRYVSGIFRFFSFV